MLHRQKGDWHKEEEKLSISCFLFHALPTLLRVCVSVSSAVPCLSSSSFLSSFPGVSLFPVMGLEMEVGWLISWRQASG